MFTVHISKGDQASPALPLANKQLSCVYLPSTEAPVDVYIWGSHDGKEFGPIYHVRHNAPPLFVTTQDHFSIRTLDPADFEGIMYFKFVLNEPAKENLDFPIYLKEF